MSIAFLFFALRSTSRRIESDNYCTRIILLESKTQRAAYNADADDGNLHVNQQSSMNTDHECLNMIQ